MLEMHHDGLSRPLESPRLRVLSLGAGVQSTTLALMAARGEIEAPDCAIFADTGDEPDAVYRHLDWLSSVLSFPVRRVVQPQSLSEAMRSGAEGGRVPFYIEGGGLKRRQCTRNWKIRPIRRQIRQELGVSPQAYIEPDAVESWIGISTDEIARVRPSGVAFIHNRHPLIEARMSRQDCERWLTERQYPIPPKSACRFCPFTDNARWASMMTNAPADFAKAVELDVWLREPQQVARYHGRTFVHRARVPLSEVDFGEADDGRFGFANECEGMCGV
jgi:hypothetical protein